MNRKAVIWIIVIVTIIILGVVGYLIYKASKSGQTSKSAAELDALKAQLAQLQGQLNSTTTKPEEKPNILSQIANLTKTLQDSGVISSGQSTGTSTNTNTGTSTNTNVVQPPGFPLKKTARGENVKNLQKGLNQKCNSKLVADGVFGILTENALNSCYNVKEANFELYNNIIS